MINNIESYNKAQLIELVKTQIEEYQKLEKTIKSLTDGVAHFNKSRGDMNPLLTAYIEALTEQGKQLREGVK